MFKDSTVKLVRLPPNTDSFLYLGAEYMSIIRSLKRGTIHINRQNTYLAPNLQTNTFVRQQSLVHGSVLLFQNKSQFLQPAALNGVPWATPRQPSVTHGASTAWRAMPPLLTARMPPQLTSVWKRSWYNTHGRKLLVYELFLFILWRLSLTLCCFSHAAA